MNNILLYLNKTTAEQIPILELGDITTKGTPLSGYANNMVSGYYNYSMFGGLNADQVGFQFADSAKIVRHLSNGGKYYPSTAVTGNADSIGYYVDTNVKQLRAIRDNDDTYYFDMTNVDLEYDDRAWLAIATISGVAYGGFLCRRKYWDGSQYVDNGWLFAYQALGDPLQNVIVNGAIQPGTGSKGFRPIRDIQNGAFGGGWRSGDQPDYNTDDIDLPGAPDESVASAVRSGLVNIYQLNEANLDALGKALFGNEGISGLITKLQNSFLNPLDAIISLQIFPCAPDLGSSENIKLFDWSCYASKLGTDTVGNRLSSQYKTYNFGTINISEIWHSYLDYDSTSMSLYLPFIGSIDIPIAEVMNGSVTVEYTVDFLTGMCVANVKCVKSVPLSSGRNVPQKTEHSFMGNCSVQIPLNNVSYGNIVGSLMQAASTGLRTGNAGIALASLVESGLSGGMQPTVSTKGTITSNAGFCSVLFPYISIIRPITAEAECYQDVEGYPSYVYGTLGDYEDLCVCDNILLDGLTCATDSEISRIKQLCKEGVYV